MKHTDFRDVSDELWERIESLLAPFKRKRSDGNPPWTALYCKLRHALKKSATEGSGRNPTDSGRSGSKIHLHVDGRGIPLGMLVTGANVHDSRLIGTVLQNSREVGGWFLKEEVRHLCVDTGYDSTRIIEEVYVTDLRSIFVAAGKNRERPTAFCPPLSNGPLGSGTNICLAEEISEPAYPVLSLSQ